MREMLAVTGAMKGAGRGGDCALVTDGASPVARTVLCRHVAPEAVDAGPIAFVRDGDRITIDVTAHTIDVDVPAAELERRQSEWKLPQPRYTTACSRSTPSWRRAPSEARSTRPEPHAVISNAPYTATIARPVIATHQRC